MKKFISAAVAAMLAFALTAPAFATTSAYVPAATTVWAYDFETESDYTTYLTSSINTLTGAGAIAADPIKGSKVAQYAGYGSWKKILQPSVNLTETLTDGKYLMCELSFKADAITSSDAIYWRYGGNTGIREFSFASGKIGVRNEGTKYLDVVPGNWYHVVLQYHCNEENTAGTLTPYINGEAYDTQRQGAFKLSAMQTWDSTAGIDVLGNVSIDDFKVWVSDTAYDPTTAGDLVVLNITDSAAIDGADLVVEGSVATLTDLAAKLSATNNGTVTFHNAADGSAVADMSVVPSSDYLVAVHSASGSVAKTYSLKTEADPIESEVYTINAKTKTISGVPFMTSITDFESNITPIEGATFAANSTNGYADAATTVTVNGEAWTIVNKSYVNQDFTGLTSNGGLVSAGFGISSQGSNDKPGPTNDVLKGGNAFHVELTDSADVMNFDLPVAGIKADGLVAGDVVNVEFNIKTTAPLTGYIQLGTAGNRAVTFHGTENMAANNDNYIYGDDTGAKFVANEWNHFVFSFDIDGLNDGGKIYDTMAIYQNGKMLKNPARADGLYINEHFNLIVDRFRMVFQANAAATILFDDVKIYKAATQAWDEAYMTAATPVTVEGYVMKDKVIYLPEDETPYDAIAGLDTGDYVPVDATGAVIENWESLTIDDVFYICENGTFDVDGNVVEGNNATRVSKYSFAREGLTSADGKVTAAYKGNGILVAAAYDENGKLLEVKSASVNNTAEEINLTSLTTAAGETGYVKAFLWSKALQPIGNWSSAIAE